MPWNCSAIVYCDTLWVFGLILVKMYPSPSIWQHEFVAAVVVVALTLTNGLTGTLNCFHLKINNLKHPSILAFNMLMPRVWGSVNHIKCTQSLVLYSRMSDWSEIQQLNSIILLPYRHQIHHRPIDKKYKSCWHVLAPSLCTITHVTMTCRSWEVSLTFLTPGLAKKSFYLFYPCLFLILQLSCFYVWGKY